MSSLKYVNYFEVFVHSIAGERTRRPKVQDTLTIPICQTSTYTFKDTAELIAFQVLYLSNSTDNCRHNWCKIVSLFGYPMFVESADHGCCELKKLITVLNYRVITKFTFLEQEGTFTSFEYGRYGNPTTNAVEEKIRLVLLLGE